MLRVGLTGSTGSGKSTVSGFLRQRGVAVIDADRTAHELYIPGSGVVRSLEAAFGPSVLDREGGVDRKRLGGIVFAEPALLAKLEEIVHPPLLVELENRLERLADCGTPWAVVEAALLLKWGPPAYIDLVVGVVAERKTRWDRLRRRGLAPADIERRLDAQIAEDRLRSAADHVIVNDGTLSELESQVESLMVELEARLETQKKGE